MFFCKSCNTSEQPSAEVIEVEEVKGTEGGHDTRLSGESSYAVEVKMQEVICDSWECPPPSLFIDRGRTRTSNVEGYMHIRFNMRAISHPTPASLD